MELHKQPETKYNLSYETNVLILEYLTHGGTIQICKPKRKQKQITANGRNKGAMSKWIPTI